MSHITSKTHREPSSYRCPAKNWLDYFNDGDITAKVKRYLARTGRVGQKQYQDLVSAHRKTIPTYLGSGQVHVTESVWEDDKGGDSVFLQTKPGFAVPITTLCFASDPEAD